MRTTSQKRVKELNRAKDAAARPRPRGAKPQSKPNGLKHALVPIDFSDHSLRALDVAHTLAAETTGTITLLHVVELLPGWEDAPLAIRPDRLAKEAEAKLERLAAERGLDPKLVARTAVRIGIPWAEITRAADDLDRDLIVIATHGYTGWKHVLLGSTAERVVRHAKCPVLVVR